MDQQVVEARPGVIGVPQRLERQPVVAGREPQLLGCDALLGDGAGGRAVHAATLALEDAAVEVGEAEDHGQQADGMAGAGEPPRPYA